MIQVSKNNLPQGWTYTTLGSIGEYLNGRAFKKHEWGKKGKPIIRIQDLTGTGKDPNYFEGIVEDRYVVRPNDFLISWSATLGAYLWKGPEGVLNQHIFKVISKIDKIFHYYFVANTINELYRHTHGSGMVHITKSKFESVPVKLPPLNEQKRIVAKIEQLFSDLDAGVETLHALKKQIKQYRQSVLKYAFEGKLTKSGSSQNWEIVKLGDVSEMCLGKMLDKNKNKGDYEPYLRNINVRWGHFDLDDLLEMRFEEKEQERYSLIKGDLVVCEGGEPGRAAVWSDEVPNMKIQKALHRIRVDENVNNRYLLYYIMLSAQNGYLEEYFTGTTIKHLTGRKLKQFKFAIPDIEEQKDVVSEIERHFSIADKADEVVDAALKQSNRLRQSILKHAFEGKLVDQDPNDEPAEKLLTRIQKQSGKESQ